MTFLLLLSPTSPAGVREMVEAHGEVLYENVGRYKEEDVKKVLQAAARLPGETLVLDVDISLGNALIRALHAFRISRPEARVILLVGGRQPGDETISAMVSLGVYDLCETDNEDMFARDFAACLRRDVGTYAMASRWHRGFRDEVVEKPRETVVIERRPVGRVTVAVAGLAAGLGCTHTALMIASFLAKIGAVALVEDAERPVFNAITGLATGKSKDVGAFRMGAVNVFPLNARRDAEGYLYDQLLAVLANYEYVVRDVGVLDASKLRELYRSHCAVVVGSASSWRIMDLVRQHNALGEDFSKITIVSSFGTENDRKIFKDATGILPLPLAWSPDPAVLPEEGEATLKHILGSLLPERKRQRSFKLF